MHTVRTGLDVSVVGHQCDGCVRGSIANGPVHRNVGPTDRGVYRRSDRTAVPGRRARNDIVFSVCRYTGGAYDGNISKLAVGVCTVLSGAVNRLHTNMVYARVTYMVAEHRPFHVSRTSRASVVVHDSNQRRTTTIVRPNANVTDEHRRRQCRSINVACTGDSDHKC